MINGPNFSSRLPPMITSTPSPAISSSSTPSIRASGKWLLTCDADRTTLLPLFARLAVDPGNSLLAAQPGLGAWLDSGLQAQWLQRPLAAALAAEADSAALPS